jgi:hypothetical protein
MRDRWYAKSKKNKYDPQIGEAAKANVALAERSEAWNKDYFDKYVAPAMTQLIKESDVNIDRQGKLFDITYDQAKTQAERFKTLGIPAQDAYIKKLDEYSAPEEQERQAQRAVGDIRVAQQGQEEQLNRRFRGLGSLDRSSPAYMSAMSDRAVLNTATEAGAATRARDAAKTLGLQMAGEKSNVLGGAFANTLAAGGAAGGASSAAAGGAANAAGVAPGGAANVNTGFGLSGKAYGANLDAYTSLGKTSMETAGPSALAQIGGLAGQLGSAYLTGGTSFLKPAGKG